MVSMIHLLLQFIHPGNTFINTYLLSIITLFLYMSYTYVSLWLDYMKKESIVN